MAKLGGRHGAPGITPKVTCYVRKAAGAIIRYPEHITHHSVHWQGQSYSNVGDVRLAETRQDGTGGENRREGCGPGPNVGGSRYRHVVLLSAR